MTVSREDRLREIEERESFVLSEGGFTPESQILLGEFVRITVEERAWLWAELARVTEEARTLRETLADAGKLPDEWEHSAKLESARGQDDSKAKVAVYRMCIRELRAALAGLPATEGGT